MKKLLLFIILTLCVLPANVLSAKAKWITTSEAHTKDSNIWIAFRKDIDIRKVPKKAMVQIAVDSKYWLWINGEMVVFEGGLKRGPNPTDTYYDELDIAPYLRKGNNQIALLHWYFGKEGFSHKNSGQAGFILRSSEIDLNTNEGWFCRIHPAFKDSGEPFPNFRLPESNILFDANLDIPNWQKADKETYGFVHAKEIGEWGSAPWNNLVKRPIPFWKDFGIKEGSMHVSSGERNDTITIRVPYNMQLTPILDITDNNGGNLIHIYTDHSVAGGADNIRAEYITKKGNQVYESLGWMNGQRVLLIVPKGVVVNSLKYRETGYDTEVEGAFVCEDDFFMRFWEKGLRTLYVNMRDTYFDCPDRERAQWWGDVVTLMGESFYMYSSSSHALMRKAILELCDWQRDNGILFSPVPAGNYNTELPAQMLASIGRFGFWNYYMNTGDRETIALAYPAVKRYLSIWSLDETGLTAERKGDWDWGDWGDNQDLRLNYAGWHYIALEAATEMANLLGYPEDAAVYQATMKKVKEGYNKCWNGFAYRHPQYHDKTDDRVQALAVISGIADESKYAQIFEVFKSQEHASPYMEKYVMESLFMMGEGVYGIERAKKRFAPMVNHPDYTTLFEGWGIGSEGFGGGTVNHAWSGGVLTVIAQYVCGVYPLEAGYKTFMVNPEPASFKEISLTTPSIAGEVKTSFVNDQKEFRLSLSVPKGTAAIVYLPTLIEKSVRINGKSMLKTQLNVADAPVVEGKIVCRLDSGVYEIVTQK